MKTLKRDIKIVDLINETFKPESKYNAAYINNGAPYVTNENAVFIKAETDAMMKFEKEFGKTAMTLFDYYGEFSGGYPTVSKVLEKLLKDNGYWYEWENAGELSLYKDR